MAQTVCTLMLLPGQKKIILEKPHSLQRIFFSLRVITSAASWYDVRVSFDDPLFSSFYSLTGQGKYFEAKGVDIFQGNIWAYNVSYIDLWCACTEILH